MAQKAMEELLAPRIEAYGLNNDWTSIESVSTYLRAAYKEYLSIKPGPFRVLVGREIAALRARGGPGKPSVDASAASGPLQNGSSADGPIAADPVLAMYARGRKEADAAAGRDAEAAGPGPMSEAAQGTGKQPPGRGGSKRPAGDAATPRRPKRARKPTPAPSRAPTVSYDDLGGIEGVLDDIRELIEYPLAHPEVYQWLGVAPPRGVLLCGPPGCGKTALAHAIANECGVPLLKISAPEIVSGMSGESEAKLRGLFQEAQDLAPCVVFIDEIDAIAAKRESAQREMERRIVAQMLTCMDDLNGAAEEGGAPGGATEGQSEGGAEEGSEVPPPRHVVVIGATNRPDALDPALRRAGRFDREISMGIPDEAARGRILRVLCRKLRLGGDVDVAAIAKRTPGFVGADLTALTKEAAALAVKRGFDAIQAGVLSSHDGAQTETQGGAGAANGARDAGEGSEAAGDGAGTDGQGDGARVGGRGRVGLGRPLTPSELRGLAITMEDFEAAVGKVQPSVRREGFSTTPGVTWADVGSLGDVREELSFAITHPIRHPGDFEAMGLTAACGVLLFGPPGCGKTLVAKAVANESGANFISIKGPELLNKYVGESERAVRQLFSRARAAAPCVLFFDELDALAPRRGSDNNQSAERVVNQLLTEMDGIDGREGVFIVAATNRPDMIDPALLRPGRLDKLLFVPLPGPDGRAEILRALARRTPLAADADLAALAASPACARFSGADLAALVREACVEAMREARGTGGGAWGAGATPLVRQRHLEAAAARVVPSVSPRDQGAYEALRRKIRTTRARVHVEAGPGARGQPSEGGEPGDEGGAMAVE